MRLFFKHDSSHVTTQQQDTNSSKILVAGSYMVPTIHLQGEHSLVCCHAEVSLQKIRTVGELKDLTLHRACVVKLPLLRAVSARLG